MTVQAVARYSPQFTADGTQTTFPYAFQIRDSTYLSVVVSGQGVPAAAYNVTGVGNPAGGTVIFFTPPNAGAVVQIFGATPFDQEVGYQEGGTFPASSHEWGLDRGAMTTMELRDALELVPSYPPWAPLVLRNQLLPEPVPLHLLGWDANGEQWAAYASTILQVVPDVGTGLSFVSHVVTVDTPGNPIGQLVAAGAFQPGIRPLGVVGYVSTAFGTTNGLTGMMLGDPDEGEDVWAASLGITLGARTFTGQNRVRDWLENPSGRDVLITGLGGDFDATGQIKITTIGFTLEPAM